MAEENSVDVKNEQRAGRLLASTNPVNPMDFIRLEENEKETAQLKTQRKEMKERLKVLEAERLEIYKNCNHVNEDGTSAWKGGFMFSACDLCGLNDL